MATKWTIKELLASVKMNQLGISKYSITEQQAIADSERLAGMATYNTDDKSLEVYQGGTGSTFNITKLTNFLFRDKTNLGIGSSLTTVYDESFVNNQGKMNTRVFVIVEYLLEASQVFEITARVTDGVSPIVETISGTAGGSPVKTVKVFEMATTSFTIDDILDIELDLKNAQVEFVEFRGV